VMALSAVAGRQSASRSRCKRAALHQTRRDRALIGIMIYTFARVDAVLQMNVGDYFSQGAARVGAPA
jgi:hypothetical protein